MSDNFLKDAGILIGILVAVVTLTLTIILPIYQRSSPIPSQVSQNGDEIQKAKDEAKQAKLVAIEARNIAIGRAIKREKICAEHNRAACSALFDRLAGNITAKQRKRLACDVLAALNPKVAEPLRVASGCPPPLPPP